MDCVEEVGLLKEAVGPLVGGSDSLSFDILNGRMTVDSVSPGLKPASILQAVQKTGLRAEVWRDEPSAISNQAFWQRHGRTILTTASAVFIALGFLEHSWIGGSFRTALGSEGLNTGQGVPLLARVIYGLAILAGSWYVLPKAWYAGRRLRPDMNLLMVIAVIGAAAIGDWFEAAMVAFLFALSLTLESWSVGRARNAIAALLDLSPTTARLQQLDGSVTQVPPTDVSVGSVFIVRPGEKIPLDGRVRRGTSGVNQAPITGESMPSSKNPGDQVFAGTINGDGVLEVECTKLAGDTTLAHIIRLVGEAQSRRAPSEQWVERFARVYTPAIMVIAVAVLIIPPLALGGDFSEWLYRALVLLVIACPCALVISTPVSIVAALAAAARNGVLIKGGLYLELPARLKAIALDKTGTLTMGAPTVVDLIAFGDHNEQDLLERVSALEFHNPHPLARAIVRFAESRGIVIQPAADLEVMQGKGARGRFNGKFYWLGSHRHLEERGQENAETHLHLEELSKAGKTVVVVGTEEHVCGFVSLADSMRENVRSTIQSLRLLGVEHVVMLTGDNTGTARAIAREAGVDEVCAELLPGDKMAVIESLVAKYGSVAMVGDGVNDAPAMGRATLGIAMGVIGTDAAVETADIALMADDLSKIPWLVRHSRRTLRVIRQNIAFSLGVKAVFVVLTFAGYASLWAAIGADTGTSLLVIANALRLLQAD